MPTENEGLVHITVPLLSALGWQPEHIAVGWKYTDFALFDPKSRQPEYCKLVIEGKRVDQGPALGSRPSASLRP